jgi:ribonuclease M5
MSIERTKIAGLIVVEGISDINFLSEFIDADFYAVKGSAVSKEDIVFLRNCQKENNIIVLTDPDFPGGQIRNYLNQNIDGLYNAYIRKEVSIKHGKVGVAESTKDEVLKALNHLSLEKKSHIESDLSMIDLYDVGVLGTKDSKEKRIKLCDFLGIGFSNGKTLLKKLRCIGIDKEKLKDLL